MRIERPRMFSGARLFTVVVLAGIVAVVIAVTASSEPDQVFDAGDTDPPAAFDFPEQDNPTDRTDPDTVTVLAAGDIGRCGSFHVGPVGTYVSIRSDATFLALGDIAYPSGSSEDFANCYDTWFAETKDRTRPTPGNTEYETEGAAAYFSYFGSRAGDPDEGYYAFDLGSWRVISLNSECWEVGGCDDGDPQYQWLEAELAANDRSCILAFWHRPYYTSESPDGDSRYLQNLWELLDREGADVLLAGHAHQYERFAPMNASNQVDPDGIRSFVVGTGGSDVRPATFVHNGSEVLNTSTYGVLELELTSTGYSWEFIRTSGGRFDDSGSGTC